jgi:hypothetical protein
LSDTYSYEGKSYNTRTVYGSGICLRHVWDPLYLDCLRIHNPTLQPTLTPISIHPKHKRLEPGLNFRITAVPSPILHLARVSGIIKRAESGSTMLKLHLLFGKHPYRAQSGNIS